MSNELMIPAPPAYLQTQVSNDWGDFAAKVVSGSFARISIKGSRWRLQELNGEENVVNALHLDVFIVYANPDKSKNYYSKPYDQTATVPAAPDCFSDNGVSPSPRASTPQCLSCAACPHNVWGSKIQPNGSKTKSCQDSQRLAVVLADNPSGTIYELRIPAASLKDMGNTIKQFVNAGYNPSTVRFRLEFDTNEEFPKIVFKAIAYATQQEWSVLNTLIGSQEAKRVTGREGGAPQVADPAPVVNNLLASPAPAYAVAAPSVFQAPPVAQVFAAPAAQTFATHPTEEVKKRTRKPKVEAPQNTFTGAPPSITPVAAPAAVAGIVVNPTPTSDSNLDNLLAGAFKL